MKDSNYISAPSTAIVLVLVFIVFASAVLGLDGLLRGSISDAGDPAQAGMVPVGGRANMGMAVNVPGSVLTQHEIAHMRYMREEEKLARDAYLTLANRWGIPAFGKIAQAEQRHMDAVLGLLTRYGIPDPAAGMDTGQFFDPNLSSLYATLMKKGATSPINAIKVGGLIEEVDIADLEFAVSSTKRQDIIRVYENIHRGSRNHLRSFAVLSAQYGVTYQPQKLSPTEVQSILSSPMENGPPQW